MEHLAWVQNREHLILEVKQKWNDVTILVSLVTPRSDELIHQTNGQIINALIKQILSGNEMILYCDHSNMLKMVIQMRTIGGQVPPICERNFYVDSNCKP